MADKKYKDSCINSNGIPLELKNSKNEIRNMFNI
jgi:hypothetical protein